MNVGARKPSYGYAAGVAAPWREPRPRRCWPPRRRRRHDPDCHVVTAWNAVRAWRMVLRRQEKICHVADETAVRDCAPVPDARIYNRAAFAYLVGSPGEDFGRIDVVPLAADHEGGRGDLAEPPAEIEHVLGAGERDHVGGVPRPR